MLYFFFNSKSILTPKRISPNSNNSLYILQFSPFARKPTPKANRRTITIGWFFCIRRFWSHLFNGEGMALLYDPTVPPTISHPQKIGVGGKHPDIAKTALVGSWRLQVWKMADANVWQQVTLAARWGEGGLNNGMLKQINPLAQKNNTSVCKVYKECLFSLKL